jgi:hypothetical protein
MMESFASAINAFFFMMFFSFDICVLFFVFYGASCPSGGKGSWNLKRFYFFEKVFYLFSGQQRRLSAQTLEGFVSPDHRSADLLRPERRHGIAQLVLQEDVIEVVVLFHDLTPFFLSDGKGD